MIKEIWQHAKERFSLMRTGDYLKAIAWVAIVNVNLQWLKGGFDAATHIKDHLITNVGGLVLHSSLYLGMVLWLTYKHDKNEKTLKYGSFLVGIPVFDALFKAVLNATNNLHGTGSGEVMLNIGIFMFSVMISSFFSDYIVSKKTKKKGTKKITIEKVLAEVIEEMPRAKYEEKDVDIAIDDEELAELLHQFKALQQEVKEKEPRDLEEIHDIDQMVERMYRLCTSYNKISDGKKEEMKQETKEIILSYIKKLEGIIEQDDKRYIQDIKILREMAKSDG